MARKPKPPEPIALTPESEAGLASLKPFDIDRALAERSLYHFVKQAWHIVESVEFSDNWHLKFLCDHLEALVRNKINNNLLINVPPGTSKSTLGSVMLPAWTWTWKPAHRFLCACYSAELSIRDSVRCREILESAWYRARWPETAIKEDLNQKIKFENSAGGWRIATTPRGRGLGEHPDTILCFPYDQSIATKNGSLPIGRIVEERMKISVPSFNTATGETEMRPIIGWYKNPGSDLVRIDLSDGSSVRCTPNHKFWTRNRGWVEARSLVATDLLPAARTQKANVLGDFHPAPASPNIVNSLGSYAKPRSQRLGTLVTGGNFTGNFFGEDSAWPVLVHRKRPVPLGIVDVLSASSVAKVGKDRVCADAIPVPNFLTSRARADKSQHDYLMDEQLSGLAASPGIESRIPFIEGRFQKFSMKKCRFRSIAATPWLADKPVKTPDPPKVGYLVVLKSRDLSPILVAFDGHVSSTYCVTVQKNHTFYVGSSQGIIAANCDDPHNTKELESESERNIVINWWDQTMGTRGIARGAGRCIIMQRLHSLDLCGHVLRQGGYEHIMLPMNFEVDRKCVTSIGEDPRTTEGELLWPSLLPESKLALVRRRLGPRGVAGQFQQRPAPKEGALFKDDDFLYFREEITEAITKAPVKDEEEKKPRWGRPVPLPEPDKKERVKCFVLERVVAGELQTRKFLERDCATFMVADTAQTVAVGSDWSVAVTFTITPEHDLLIRNIWRDKIEIPMLYAALDNQRRRAGPDVLFMAVENKGSGMAVIQTAAADGRPMRPLEPGRWGKEVRASQASMLYAAKKVWHLADARWLPDLEGELLTFPNGMHDDLCDAIAYGSILCSTDEILRIRTGGHDLSLWAEAQDIQKPKVVEMAGGIRVLLDINDEDEKPWWKR